MHKATLRPSVAVERATQRVSVESRGRRAEPTTTHASVDTQGTQGRSRPESPVTDAHPVLPPSAQLSTAFKCSCCLLSPFEHLLSIPLFVPHCPGLRPPRLSRHGDPFPCSLSPVNVAPAPAALLPSRLSFTDQRRASSFTFVATSSSCDDDERSIDSLAWPLPRSPPPLERFDSLRSPPPSPRLFLASSPLPLSSALLSPPLCP